MMNILIVSSEVSPFAKTGGLADFAGSLPIALRQLGHDVRVITPKYNMSDEHSLQLSPVVEHLDVPISNRLETCAVLEGTLGGTVPIYFVQNDTYYHRDHLYGDSQGDYPDNAERFIYFSRSILEICKAVHFVPDILHCYDWQTGLVPVYLRKFYQADPFFEHTAAVFTICDISRQGLFWHYDMHLTGLGWDLFTPDGLEYYGKINLLKGGLLWADILTTVSPTYSRDIQRKEHGHGMEGVLQYRSEDLYGVVNGVDYTDWNPATDPYIAKNYHANTLSRKKSCKKQLLKEFELPTVLSRPVLGMVSHLTAPKGLDLLEDVLDALMKLPLFLILLGTGHEKYHTLFHHFRDTYPEKIGVRFEQTNTLEHKILAGADMLLIPSRYEPCGFRQIYSLKYGTIPIVHAVGGLNDTVKAVHVEKNIGTGITFSKYQADRFLNAIQEGLLAYQDKKSWRALQQRAMAEDFSWSSSAKEHEALYHKAREKFSASDTSR